MSSESLMNLMGNLGEVGEGRGEKLRVHSKPILGKKNVSCLSQEPWEQSLGPWPHEFPFPFGWRPWPVLIEALPLSLAPPGHQLPLPLVTRRLFLEDLRHLVA